MRQPRSMQHLIFRTMLLLILAVSAARLVIWVSYQAYEASQGNIVLYEEFNELLILVIIDLVAIPLVVYLLLRIVRNVTDPLRRIGEMSQSIGRGQFEERVDENQVPPGELRDVVHALNAAFDRYEESNARIASFTADASHQLRTPLTMIHNAAELANEAGQSEESYREALGSVQQDSERVGRMIDQLLMIARLDHRRLRATFSLLDVSEVITQVVDDFAPLAEDREMNMVLQIPEVMSAMGEAGLLYEALANLIDNAIKACGREGRIEVNGRSNGEQHHIQIVDSGPGISLEDRPKIFNRFHRSEEHQYSGSGLGLAICKEIVEAHGGSISYMISPLGGAGFSILLPMFRGGAEEGG